MDSPTLLLCGYAAAIAAVSLFGGWLPSAIRLTRARAQLATTFVAGLILGAALYHLLPHGFALLEPEGAIDTAAWWTMLGLVCMMLLLRVFDFHQHDFSADRHPADAPRHSLGWAGIALGLSLHSMIEGLALGATLHAGRLHGGSAELLGGGVFLAILLCKPLDALSVTGTMRAAGFTARARLRANVGFALVVPAAAFLAYWGVDSLGAAQDAVLARALAFSAGAFLCVALSDLLPEIHFHRHDRLKLTAAFLIGIALSYALIFVEPDHAHGH